MNMLKKIWERLKTWFWEKPIAEPEPLRATDVLHNYICFKYRDQWINLHKSDLVMWNSLSRKDRRAMSKRFEMQEKKGHIKFVEINGKMTCIKNKFYENRRQ